MISFHTNVVIADNSGARKGQCIKILGGSNHKTATIGDLIVVAIKRAKPKKKVKKGEVKKAIIIRTTKTYCRYNGICIKFSQNAAVIVNQQLNPIATRIFGPVIRELRDRKLLKILSMAPSCI